MAGHRGLVGSAILRRLGAAGFTDLCTVGREDLDLRHQSAVDAWFDVERPRYVFLVAGTVGGTNVPRPAAAISARSSSTARRTTNPIR